MNKLLSLNPVKRANDVPSLRKLNDECEVHVRSLDAVGVVAESYGSLLCPILMKMIPDEITLEFTRRMDKGSVLKVKELMDYVKREVESRERTADLILKRESASHSIQITGMGKTQRRQTLTKPSRVCSRVYAANSEEMNCIFYSKNDHRSKDCSQFTVEIRRSKLKRMARCYVCFGDKHIAWNCRAQRITCSNCGDRPHKTVCSQMLMKPVKLNPL